MIEKAIAKWNIDRKISFMIGDKISDKLAAKKSNIKFLYRSKHNFYINRLVGLYKYVWDLSNSIKFKDK